MMRNLTTDHRFSFIPPRLIVVILVHMSRGAMPRYHIIKEKKRMRSPSSFRGSFRPPTFSVSFFLPPLKGTEKNLNDVSIFLL